MLLSDAGHYRIETSIEPCRDCRLRSRCRDERLACALFEQFVDRGRFDLDAPRRPTSRTFRALFGNNYDTQQEPRHDDADRNRPRP